MNVVQGIEVEATPATTSGTRVARESWVRSKLGIAATALVVCFAYYVGAHFGFILRLPLATPSVLWPPNAILTATLLLAPARRWWIYLLAALPAHLVAELGVSWPAPLVLGLFVTNCSEALVAAVCVRRLSDAPARLDTLGRVVAFIVGAVLTAPFISSFADAMVVALLGGEPYWLVWRTRFFSNVLSALTLVPAIVTVVTVGPAWFQGGSLRRQVEAALLAVGLLTIGTFVFIGSSAALGATPVSQAMATVFLLPFLLWAAVRFGPRGTSFSLLITALLAIWAATHGGGPFAPVPLAESILAVQILLTGFAIPLLCLAALMEERRQAEAALGERLRFEELLSDLSGAFGRLPRGEMDHAIEVWLGRLGEFFGVDVVTIRRFSGDGQSLALSHSWAASRSGPALPVVARQDVPWAVQHLLSERLIVFTRANELPDNAPLDRDWFRRAGFGSGLILPLTASGRVFGCLAFLAIPAERSWSGELVQRLRLVAEIFASALARSETEDALHTNALITSAIMSSVSSNVAVLNRVGRVIAVSEGWIRLEGEREEVTEARLDGNYLDVWRLAARQGAPYAREVLAGLVAVLDRSLPEFTVEYPHRTRAGNSWWAMSVLPLNRPEGGAVVSHTDVTKRKRAELDAQHSRQELAHFTRVSTMGELAASLAHELNQPLTAILANALAGRRFLEARLPDLGEIRSILTDIIEDDKRAGDVIRRVRELLRKGESEFRRLDLNNLIRDVVRLLGSDAVIRNVTVTLDLDPRSPVVMGDPVQLQQVVLNLLLNAMEAIGKVTGGDRTIVVRTVDLGSINVSIEDSGPGLYDDSAELVFQPFYTTKPGGLGMGLAIARSILLAHGGTIWAVNSPIRGATFYFTLPAASDESA